MEKGADVNKTNHMGETLLIMACRIENEMMVKYLVAYEADVNKENRDGETPLLIVCKNGNDAIVKYLVENRSRC